MNILGVYQAGAVGESPNVEIRLGAIEPLHESLWKRTSSCIVEAAGVVKLAYRVNRSRIQGNRSKAVLLTNGHTTYNLNALCLIRRFEWVTNAKGYNVASG